MSELMKVLESKMKIRFHDCDPFNHLNNSRYIDYIITARGDQLLEFYQLDIYKLTREQGIGWVAGQTKISYISPALLMEDVTIQTRLQHFSQKSLLLEGLMWNDDMTVLKAIMWTKLIHFNLKTQKSQEHSPELMQLFEQVVYPSGESEEFDERVENLVGTVKNPVQ